MPATERVHEAKSLVVRTKVVEAAARLLADGHPLTFKQIAERSGVPERTVYRYFPSRTLLLAALFEWTNAHVGHHGARPTNERDLVALVRAAFRAFDDLAPVVRQMLIEPDGRSARLADLDHRRRAAVELVHNEAPGLDEATTERTAAAIQTMSTAATWQTLHDYWDLDGAHAAEVAALAIELMLEGARARAGATTTTHGAR